MQPSDTGASTREELRLLSELDQRLRVAIATALAMGHTELAVALDDARNFIEAVLTERQPSDSRVFIAKVRAEMALGVYKRLCERGAEREPAGV